jgi:hypothetical protein
MDFGLLPISCAAVLKRNAVELQSPSCTIEKPHHIPIAPEAIGPALGVSFPLPLPLLVGSGFPVEPSRSGIHVKDVLGELIEFHAKALHVAAAVARRVKQKKKLSPCNFRATVALSCPREKFREIRVQAAAAY